jgi:hypothetical protein
MGGNPIQRAGFVRMPARCSCAHARSQRRGVHAAKVAWQVGNPPPVIAERQQNQALRFVFQVAVVLHIFEFDLPKSFQIPFEQGAARRQ